MVETKTIGKKRIGQERWKYLDMANMSFAAGDYIATDGYIKAFLETIKNDSEEAQIIRNEFDQIDFDRRKQLQDLQTQIKDMGYLEQADYDKEGRRQIEIEAIYNRTTVCWTLAVDNNLFEA